MTRITRTALYLGGPIVAATVAVAAATSGAAAPVGPADTAKFSGAKANTGTVMHTSSGMKHTLTLSDDFKVPDTPDPHWQIVDSKGTVYLLDRLPLKGDRVSRSITLPSYIPDVQKVVIWCAWAEANLGEASFSSTLKLR